MTSRPLLILVCGCILTGSAAAGSLDAPAAPTDAGSAMYTLEDLYNRLNAGTAGTPRPGAFVEPATGPGSTMHTLTQIMNRMPAVDANGAKAADVLSGKTFWGLTSGAWGLQTGAMPIRTVINTMTSQSAGYYKDFDLATVDTDLAAGNIKSGISIFGVVGTYTGSGATFSAPFPVAKTGQTTPYAGGDDGILQKGVAWPSPRFTDNSNGTVTDNLTGLVWLKNADCAGTMNWTAAMTWVAALVNGSCGLTDSSVPGQWRLPNIKELNSLVNAGVVYPALPAGHPFVGSVYSYWSSTTDALYPSLAWAVIFQEGHMLPYGKSSLFFVWPVRGGQ